MNSSIIELKENESLKSRNEGNGEYSINLKKNLTLNNGDELIIKNVFVDTIASSGGLIVIPNDLTATMTFCRGFTYNTGISADTTGTALNTLNEPDLSYHIDLNVPSSKRDDRHLKRLEERVGSSNFKKGDGFSYFMLDEKNVPVGHNFKVASNITFFSEMSSSGVSGKFGGVSITFAFKSIDGTIRNVSIQLLNADSNGQDGQNFFQEIEVLSFVYDPTWTGDNRGFLNGGIELLASSSKLESHNLSQNFLFGGGVFPSGNSYTLKEDKINISILKGNYDPNDLARIITDQIVKRPSGQYKQFNVEYESQIFPFPSPIYGQVNNTISVSDPTGYFISSDGQVLLRLNLENNVPIAGCNQFSLIFDDAGTRTFKIVSMHTPYYVDISAGGQSNLQIGTDYVPEKDADPSFVFQPYINTKRGEIIITGLNCVDDKGDYVDFWFSQLGLNPNIICAGHSNLSDFRYNIGGADINVRVARPQLIQGVNSTDAFLGIDSIMGNNILVPTVTDFTTKTMIANLMTTPIFGLKTLGQITDSQGYFLIEISGYNNSNRIISEKDVKANIGAIVSRFYASTSYTNGYIQDSVSYSHVGESITLSNFSIRILNPSHNPSNDIGNDSSIFLMLNKAEPNKTT